MHFQIPQLALALILPSLVLTHPLQPRDISISKDQILAAAPKSASCDNAPAAGECRTNEQAADPIQNSFRAYNIASPGEQAAVLSIMAFESGDFKYDTPINKEPGKGTRNMQSAEFNAKFAASIPGMGEKVSQCSGDSGCVLKILTSNDYFDFASGAWFLATQCDPQIRAGLAKGDQEDWEKYITGCVHTTVTDDRVAGWQLAIKALNGK